MRNPIKGQSTGDLGANATFAAFRVNEVDCAAFQVVYPAAWNGSWLVEVSQDSTNGLDGTFTATPPDAAAPASDAGAGSFTLKVSKIPFTGWMRLRFARTSGSGISTVHHSAKGT